MEKFSGKNIENSSERLLSEEEIKEIKKASINCKKNMTEAKTRMLLEISSMLG